MQHNERVKASPSQNNFKSSLAVITPGTTPKLSHLISMETSSFLGHHQPRQGTLPQSPKSRRVKQSLSLRSYSNASILTYDMMTVSHLDAITMYSTQLEEQHTKSVTMECKVYQALASSKPYNTPRSMQYAQPPSSILTITIRWYRRQHKMDPGNI